MFSTLVAVGSLGCLQPPRVWTHEVGPAFEGSPTYCDLDDDGQRELVLPVAPTDYPELSLLEVRNASTGELRWSSERGTASFAYPLCLDVDGDGVLDLITGGRIQDVRALSGVDGAQLWSLREQEPDLAMANTYSTVSAPRVPGVLVTTRGGGGSSVDETERLGGSVQFLGRDGSLRAEWPEPDGREVYSTPAVAFDEATSSLVVVVGSGGEVLGGRLWVLEYDLAAEQVVELGSVASACDTGGFIASPTLGDIDGDGELEAVAADWCGSVVATELADASEAWSAELPHPYTTGNPLLVDVDADGALDVVVAAGEFNWTLPDTYGRRDSTVRCLAGSDGRELWSYAIAKHVWASPVSADIDADGTEDIFIIGTDVDEMGNRPPPSRLVVLSGRDGAELFRYESVSWMGTPLIDDVDGNGDLDVLLVDAPFNATAFGTGFLPAEAFVLEFPGIGFDPLRSFSGFRGPSHDGVRR